MITADNDGVRAMKLRINKLRLDGGTQPRAVVDYATVEEYADAMQNGAEFPPVIVFYDGSEYWLADGFHRVHASMTAGFEEVFADVRQGTRRDAVLYSVGANAVHGMRRTNADKRRAVRTLLEDEEWAKWSNNKIAQQCAVSLDTVNRMRREIVPLNESLSERTYVTKHGTVAQMNTENIGRRAIITNEGELIVEDDEPAAVPTPASHPHMRHEPSSPLSDPLAIERHVDEHAPEDDESEAMYLTKLNYKRLSRKERTAFLDWLKLRGDVR